MAICPDEDAPVVREVVAYGPLSGGVNRLFGCPRVASLDA